jgi:hypothetical protein
VYKGQEQHWDDLIAKVLTEQCAIGEKNVRSSSEFIERQGASAKQRMDEIEQLLKNKNLSETDHKMIQETPAFLQQCVFRISEDLQDLVTANIQYRGSWPANSRELLSPTRQVIVEPYVNSRMQQIDGQGAVMAKKKRCEEYILRAVELAKQAAQKKEQGGVDVATFNVDMEEIKNHMTSGKAAIEANHFKKARAIQYLKDLEKTKVWTPEQSKSTKSWLAEITSNAKNARGSLKTLSVEIEGLEKRGKAAGPGWKEQAAKAVTEARKLYNQAELASKKFGEDEEKCKKICKDHNVTV